MKAGGKIACGAFAMVVIAKCRIFMCKRSLKKLYDDKKVTDIFSASNPLESQSFKISD